MGKGSPYLPWYKRPRTIVLAFGLVLIVYIATHTDKTNDSKSIGFQSQLNRDTHSSKVATEQEKQAKQERLDRYFNYFAKSTNYSSTKLVLLDDLNVKLLANRDIKAGETFLDVAFTSVLSNRNTRPEIEPLKAISDKVTASDEKETTTFALFLMYLKLHRDDPDSIYVDFVPEQCGHLNYFTEYEMDNLQDSTIPPLEFRLETDLRRAYTKIFDSVSTSKDAETYKNYSYDLFKWAMRCTESRFFWGTNKLVIVVPIVEFMNHESTDICGSDNFWWNTDTKSMQFVANKDYKKGDEMYICYNKLSNYDSLQYYGFAFHPNHHDRLYLTIGQNTERVGEQDLTTRSKALKELCKGLVEDVEGDEKAEKVEKVCVPKVQGAVAKALADFPTTLEDDQQRLSGMSAVGTVEQGMTWNTRFGLMYRIGQKTLLSKIQELL